MERYMTIGMAGHIDHGKTTLTKALTGIDTDRLQEEKLRNISIEPGFALLFQEEDLEVALIDVPGHERFIRQMIAGVSGIDAVILTIAADEGIMPQTKEHIHILSLLGIEHGIIVLTKVDEVDDEWLQLVQEEVKETLQGTFLEHAPLYFVDSVSGRGIEEFKTKLRSFVDEIDQKEKERPFRLPIDQIFTVKGQGVVVRGTVYDGTAYENDELMLLPKEKRVRVRQIQRHKKQVAFAKRGQRAAFNLAGVQANEITRGDVLTKGHFYQTTNRIDVELTFISDVQFSLKQRQTIKCYIGTSEVMGRIIFFDRNEWRQGDEKIVLCQIELADEVVATRGDRFIIRRPTPVETVGGGWIIDANATKHRFGKQTIEKLTLKRTGTIEDRIAHLLQEQFICTKQDMIKQLQLTEQEFMQIEASLVKIESNIYTLDSIFHEVSKNVLTTIERYHDTYPLRIGMDVAVIRSTLRTYPDELVDAVIDDLSQKKRLKVKNEYVASFHFQPHPPETLKGRYEALIGDLNEQQIAVEKWKTLIEKHNIEDRYAKDLYHYLIDTEKAYVFDEARIVSKRAVLEACKALSTYTNRKPFTLQEARECLQLTRKNLIPLLELFDRLRYTKRVENERHWLN